MTSQMEVQNSLIVSNTARLEWTETSAHCYIQITFPSSSLLGASLVEVALAAFVGNRV